MNAQHRIALVYILPFFCFCILTTPLHAQGYAARAIQARMIPRDTVSSTLTEVPEDQLGHLGEPESKLERLKPGEKHYTIMKSRYRQGRYSSIRQRIDADCGSAGVGDRAWNMSITCGSDQSADKPVVVLAARQAAQRRAAEEAARKDAARRAAAGKAARQTAEKRAAEETASRASRTASATPLQPVPKGFSDAVQRDLEEIRDWLK